MQAEGEDTLQVVVSLADVTAGVTPDLENVTATFDEEPLEVSAQMLSDAAEEVRRTTILAMDVSESMRGVRFQEAKAAANVFLDNVPDDVYVGVVTFAGDVEVAQEPTRETDEVRAVVDKLRLSRQTRLYDGLIEAVKASGQDGSRSVLVLSDGRDTSTTSLKKVAEVVEDAKVKVDVVALSQSVADKALLQQISDAGGGVVLDADDPAALSELFADEAQALAQQVLVTIKAPAAMAGREGTLAVTVEVDDKPVTDQAFVALPAGGASDRAGKDASSENEEAGAPVRPVKPSLMVPPELMYAGLGAAAVGFLIVVVLVAGGTKDPKQDAIDRSIEAYTRKGAKRLEEAHRQAEAQSMTQQAVAVAESVLEGQKGLEVALGSRLEAAGIALKPAEWLLLHFGVAVALGMAGLLLGGGNAIFMLVALVLGLVLPWLYLGFKKRRRLAAFSGQLADTLQLMSGSLSAGLSLAQSLDTVVREGAEPMAGELRRVLVEARLGVQLEEALMGVAERMGSVDFEWVVMAIRIQREVGGNLSELLNKVAETIREREYLERQVATLSAEGRLSVWILGGLPPAFLSYLALANPPYVKPLVTTPLGLVMMTVMSILLVVGIFWMKRVTKVKV